MQEQVIAHGEKVLWIHLAVTVHDRNERVVGYGLQGMSIAGSDGRTDAVPRCQQDIDTVRVGCSSGHGG